MNRVEISVVMPVFNEAQWLDETIQSVLHQNDVELELIIVDDGSSDGSAELLNDWVEKDKRISVITQANIGITRALIEGCNAAQGEFIARQDAGDVSYQNRLREQLQVFQSNPKAVLCSTGASFYSERGEHVFDSQISGNNANAGLKPESLAQLIGPPHHGCTMFRRSAYEACGGYRPVFKVAQDLDLWTRLMDFGAHESLQVVYYKAILRPSAISTRRRAEQQQARVIIFDCVQSRARTGNDSVCLKALLEIQPRSAGNQKDHNVEYDYFIGSNLSKTQVKQSRYYFKKVLRQKPWHFKSWIKLITSYLQKTYSFRESAPKK